VVDFCDLIPLSASDHAGKVLFSSVLDLLTGFLREACVQIRVGSKSAFLFT